MVKSKRSVQLSRRFLKRDFLKLDKEFLYRNPDSKYPFPKYKE